MKTKIFAVISVVTLALWAWASDLTTLSVGDCTPTNSMIARGNACTFLGAYGQNTNAVTIYIQIHETNAIPLANAIPLFSVPVGSNQFYSIEPSATGMAMQGIVVVTSSSPWGYTASSVNCSMLVNLSPQPR